MRVNYFPFNLQYAYKPDPTNPKSCPSTLSCNPPTHHMLIHCKLILDYNVFIKQQTSNRTKEPCLHLCTCETLTMLTTGTESLQKRNIWDNLCKATGRIEKINLYPIKWKASKPNPSEQNGTQILATLMQTSDIVSWPKYNRAWQKVFHGPSLRGLDFTDLPQGWINPPC
jgi:hypothetical protein